MPVNYADFLGIDVSKNNGNVDWAKVAQDQQNIKFTYIKATEGTTLQDPTFAKNRQGANDAGLITGAYHFYSLTSEWDTQADNFINIVGHLNDGDLPPMLDFEKTPDPNDVNKTIDDLHQWLDKVEGALGKKPGIYTANNYWHNILNNPDGFTDHPLWVAKYGANNAPLPPMPVPPLFGGWDEFAMWQFTSIGRVDGISTVVDVNRYNLNSGILPSLS